MEMQDQLKNLKDAYYAGVLKVREKDTWVEYQSMKEMRIAISELQNEINNTRPTGTKRAIVRRMF